MHRSIPKTGRSVFPIGLGAMPLSIDNRPHYADAIKIIHHYIEQGGNFIDTANIYGINGDDIGHNEKLIADAMKKIGNPEDIIISTKGGGTRPDNGWGLGAGHPKQLRSACEKSLKALSRESIELYYLHGPDSQVPFLDSIGAMLDLKQEGKIQHVGIANVSLEQVKQALTITEIAAVQNRCNPFCKQDMNQRLVDYCAQNEIVYVPYCPLGGWADNPRLAQSPHYISLKNKYHISSYVINLAWLLQKGENILPIPGIHNSNQIDENFSAVSIKLEPADILFIDSFPDHYEPTA